MATGAPVAGSALPKCPHIKAYAAIGYVFGFWASILFGGHYQAVLQADVPRFFVMGDRDGFTSVRQLQQRLATARGKCESHVVQGVGHFQLEMSGYDAELAALILQWLNGAAAEP